MLVFQVGRSPIPQFDAFTLKPDRQYHFRVTARSRRGEECQMMTRERVDLARATTAPEVVHGLSATTRVLAGQDISLECKV